MEHGHQYDPANCFPSALCPLESPAGNQAGSSGEHIFLPMGSIFVRYLFNRVETSSPYADNVKPETRFIGWFIRNHPFRAFLFLVTDGRKMLRKIRESWKSAGRAEESLLVHNDPRYSPNNHAFSTDNDSVCQGKSVSGRQQATPGKDWQNLAMRLEEIQARPLFTRPSGAAARALLSLLGPGWIITFLLGMILLNLTAVSLFLSPLWSLLLPDVIGKSAFLGEILHWNRQYQVPLVAIITQLAAGGALYFLITRRRAELGLLQGIKGKSRANR